MSTNDCTWFDDYSNGSCQIGAHVQKIWHNKQGIRIRDFSKPFSTTQVFQPKAGRSMKHPTPSDFIVNDQESHVSVIKPSDSYYSFGRLADPEDILRVMVRCRVPRMRDTQKLSTLPTIHRKRSHRWRTRWLSKRSQPHS